MSNDELRESLKLLNIDKDLESVYKKDLNDAFKKMAKILHPDKSGDNATTAQFQMIRKAYDKLNCYVENRKDAGPDDPEIDELFFSKNF